MLIPPAPKGRGVELFMLHEHILSPVSIRILEQVY